MWMSSERGVEAQRVAITECESAEVVGGLEAFTVVHGDRAERSGLREIRGVEVRDVVAPRDLTTLKASSDGASGRPCTENFACRG
jgi:hypothetical protein